MFYKQNEQNENDTQQESGKCNLFNKLPRGQTIFLFLLFGQTEINFRIFEYLFDEEQEPLKSLLFQGSH